MNRNVLIAILLVVLAAGAYGWYTFTQQAPEAPATTGETAAPATTGGTETAPATTGGTETAPATTGATTAPAAPAGDVAALLDPASFDAEKIKAAIDAATALDEATRTTLKAAVDSAAANPALVQSTIDQIKAALGL